MYQSARSELAHLNYDITLGTLLLEVSCLIVVVPFMHLVVKLGND